MIDNINEVFDSLISNLIEILPDLILAIGLLIGGWLFAIIVERLVKRAILYLNKIANENLKRRFLNVDLKGSARFVSKTLYWIIILITLLACIHLLKFDFLSDLLSRIVAFLPNIIVAIVIIFAGVISARLADDLIRSAAARTGLNLGKYLGKIIRYLILSIAIIVAVDHLGINIRFLTNLIIILVSALLFGAALAFGLGAQTSVSNILASYYVRKSYQLGDKVLVGDVTGVIVKITDHSVLLETPSGEVHIPAKIFNELKAVIIKD